MPRESPMSYADQLRPAVFLDRDGTIIEDRGVLAEPSDAVFYPDTVDALKRLQEHFLLFGARSLWITWTG
jgi:histidinol phosphatase-like enzyme